jgi:catechol 2,3-dioxygenase
MGEVAIRVLDMGEAREHYGKRMGLHEVMTDAAGQVYFKAWDEHDHHCLVLREAESSGMDYFAFKVFDDAPWMNWSPGSAPSACRWSTSRGVYPKSGRRLQFTLPSGHVMQLYAHKEQTGNSLPLLNPG